MISFFLSSIVLLGGLALAQAPTEAAERLNHQVLQLYEAGRYREAIRLAKRALAIREQVLGPDHPDVAQSLNNLAVLYKTLGDYAQAQPLYQRALAIWEQALGPEHPHVAVSLNNLALLYQDRGDYARAEPLYQRALAIKEEALPLNDPLVANSLNNLAVLYQDRGDYARAEPLYQRGLTIREKALGPNHPDVAQSLNNLAVFYKTLGDYAQAERVYQRALAIWEQALGPHHPEVAVALHNLAALYQALGDYVQAEPLYRRSLSVLEKALGPNHLNVAITKGNIGFLYLAQRRLAEAYKIFEREKISGGLGRYYLLKGDYRAAQGQFREDLEYLKKVRESDHILAAFIGLALAHEGLNEYKEAAQAFQEAVILMEDQRAALPPVQRTHFLAGEVGAGFKRIEAYEGLVRVRMKQQDPAGALFWAEHTKARRFLEQVSARPDRPRPGLLVVLAQEEIALTTKLTGLLRSREAAQGKNPALVKQLDQKDLPQAKQALAAFVTKLRQSHPAYAAVMYPQPLPVSALSLDPQAAYLVYEVTEPVTYAWVVQGGKVVAHHTIPLTRAALTAQVKAYRAFFEVPTDADFTRRQEADAFLRQFDPKAGQALYDQLVKPLVAKLPPGTPLTIVPDEILGILPFAALVVAGSTTSGWTTTGEHGPTPTGLTYLGEQVPLTLAHSLTAVHLARTLPSGKAQSTEKLLVVADPVFDVTTDARAQGKTVVATAPARCEAARILRAVGEAAPKAAAPAKKPQETKVPEQTCPVLLRLPQTGALARSLQQTYGPAAEVLTGLMATEPGVRARPLGTYRTLVFATHGVLDDQLPYVKEPALVLTQVGTDPTDPMQDGFLTLRELLDLNLHADLVALTACSTGLGKELTGEGVTSLGRAVQVAGAQRVLITLWSVEAASAVQLTEAVLTATRQGLPLGAALRQAQGALRQTGFSHPYWWAGLVGVGGGTEMGP